VAPNAYRLFCAIGSADETLCNEQKRNNLRFCDQRIYEDLSLVPIASLRCLVFIALGALPTT
jgi:hypothetical protein